MKVVLALIVEDSWFNEGQDWSDFHASKFTNRREKLYIKEFKNSLP